MNEYFVKYMRNPQLLELYKKRPTAIGLLILFLQRAKNINGLGDPELAVGEAYLGDYKTYGATLQIYRTDKKFLKDWQILTFKSTNKGTIAKLINRAFFDVEWKKLTTKSTNKLTYDQQATNKQPTTNIEIRNKKYINIWDYYSTVFKTKEKLTPMRKEKIKARLKTFSDEEIKKAISNAHTDKFYSGDNDKGWKADFDYIFKSDEVMDRLINLKPRRRDGLSDEEIEERII